MKLMNELNGLSAQARQDRLQETRKELLKLRTQSGMGTGTARPGKLKQAKKMIARLLTISSREVKKSS